MVPGTCKIYRERQKLVERYLITGYMRIEIQNNLHKKTVEKLYTDDKSVYYIISVYYVSK